MQNKQAQAACTRLQLDLATSFGAAVQRAAASPLTSYARRTTHPADGALITKNCTAHHTPTLSSSCVTDKEEPPPTCTCRPGL